MKCKSHCDLIDQNKNLIFIGILFVFVSYASTQAPIPQCVGVWPGEFVRDVSDCKKWIRCEEGGNATWGDCPEGYVFKSETQKCTRNADHCYQCPSPLGITFEAIEDSCNRYIRCINNKSTEITCLNDLQFDRNTKQCNLAENVGCDIVKEFACPLNLGEVGYKTFTDEYNCSIGFICFGDREPYVVDCGEELHFDIDNLACGLTEGSTCVEKPSTPARSTTEFVSTTTTPASTTPPTTTADPGPGMDR